MHLYFAIGSKKSLLDRSDLKTGNPNLGPLVKAFDRDHFEIKHRPRFKPHLKKKKTHKEKNQKTKRAEKKKARVFFNGGKAFRGHANRKSTRLTPSHMS